MEEKPLRAPKTVFWAGLVVRVLYITLAHTYRIRPAQDHFQFGWEMGRIARALATGYGYADPFTGHTGPTAWCPPLYPLLLAGIFKLFGVYTPFSAWVILTVNSIASAATSLAVYEIAARCYDRRTALWSAWLWALYPAAMQYAVRWVWEMSVTTFLFACVLVVALRLRGTGSLAPTTPVHRKTVLWAVFGLLWGLIALTNTTLLLFLPVCGIWMLLGSRTLAQDASRAALGAVLCLLCIAPWMLRNWHVFHAVVPIRGNFGAELYSSLLEGNNGFVWGPTVPLVEQAPAYRQYKEFGEYAFVQRQGRLANAYLKAHKKTFLELAAKRFYFFWVSVPHPTGTPVVQEAFRVFLYAFSSLAGLMGLTLSLRNRVPAAGLFAWAFVLLPITYYFIIPGARFRHPLEPLITMFAVYLFRSAKLRTAASQPSPPLNPA